MEVHHAPPLHRLHCTPVLSPLALHPVLAPLASLPLVTFTHLALLVPYARSAKCQTCGAACPLPLVIFYGHLC
jgi:hypothetical protein